MAERYPLPLVVGLRQTFGLIGYGLTNKENKVKKSASLTVIAFAVAVAAVFGSFGWNPFSFGW